MNLHDLRGNRIAIWLSASGANGHHIGTHLWVIEEGEPPDITSTRSNWENTHWWRPRRFLWTPYNHATMNGHPWTPPLCGARSASRRPRYNWASRYNWTSRPSCNECIRVAAERGILGLLGDDAVAQSQQYQRLRAEEQEWNDLGRPGIWPVPPEPSNLTPT